MRTVIAPLDLANKRENGVRTVEARCEACEREPVVNCDALPAGLPVRDAALRLPCSACQSQEITTKPNWTGRPRVV